MKRPRPYIPLSVRVQVVDRQLAERYGSLGTNLSASLSRRIATGLDFLDIEHPQLDHDPALILREFNPHTGKYTPDANDPDHLIYREKGNHDEKTFGRKEGAERTVTTKGSDIWLKSKFNRLEGRTKKRPKKAWPKGQKLQSRGFAKRRKP